MPSLGGWSALPSTFRIGHTGSARARSRLTLSELQDAKLDGANLRGAKVKESQLAEAHSRQGTTLPDGTIQEDSPARDRRAAHWPLIAPQPDWDTSLAYLMAL